MFGAAAEFLEDRQQKPSRLFWILSTQENVDPSHGYEGEQSAEIRVDLIQTTIANGSIVDIADQSLTGPRQAASTELSWLLVHLDRAAAAFN